MYGIKARIMPPDATFPDQIKLTEATLKEETEKIEKLKAAIEPEKPSQTEPSETQPETQTQTNTEPKKPTRKTEPPPPKETEPTTTEQTTEEPAK
jgi:hypothetical protein